MKDKKGKPKNPWQTGKRLFSYISKDYLGRFLIVIGSIIFSTLASVSISLSLKYLIDDYIIPLMKEGNPDFTNFYQALSILAAIFFVGIVATFIKARIMVIIGQGVIKNIRDEMFTHLQRLPIAYFDENSHGNIMSRFTNDTDTLRQMLNQSLPQILQSFIMITATFIAMVSLSPRLTLVAILMLILMYIAGKYILKNSGKYFVLQQSSLGHVSGFIEERVVGQKVVKIFNYEEKTKEEFDKVNEELFRATSKANGFANITAPVIANIGNLQFVVTAVLGGVLAIKGYGITFGVLAAFLQFTKSFTQPIMQMGQQFNTIVMALAGAERIFTMLDETPEIDEGSVELVRIQKENGKIVESDDGEYHWKKMENGEPVYIPVKGDVRFENMSFGYEEGQLVLKDLNLYAKPGQKLAFVGSTGAGKTTIMNLVNRFYDVKEGRILYDGIDVKDIKKADLRRSLGIVLQDTHLFTGTIRENIRYGNIHASDEEVKEAAKLAYADTFIERMPKGYDTVLSGDGEDLSQGQRQLISIARAAITHSPVLILDEATSNIDTRTEAIVQRGMDNLMKGKTVFVIAHRLSTIKNSNAIIVLDHGKIMERGDHQDLMEQKGIYYELYTGKREMD